MCDISGIILLIAGHLKSLNCTFWCFDVHDHLCISNVGNSKHGDVHLCEGQQPSVIFLES